MKCRAESDIRMSSSTPFGGVFGNCNHKFCQSCFRRENTNLASSLTHTFNCPCCHALFYGNMLSIDEAILIGEAATLSEFIDFHVSTCVTQTEADNVFIMFEKVIKMLEAALWLNPTNLTSLYFRFTISKKGYIFHSEQRHTLSSTGDVWCIAIYDYAYRILDCLSSSEVHGPVRSDCFIHLANMFSRYYNHSAAYKYAKLAYEQCLRSSDHTKLADYRSAFLDHRATFAELPPLRFAVGDEVEFLHELETGSENEWKLGKVVELYYRERAFDINFSAPYHVQLLDDIDSADQPPMYACVKADIDRYIRKVGVRSIDDTRYQVRLDAKVEDLVKVYRSEEFIQNIYQSLAEDQDFVVMLHSEWQIVLSYSTLSLYRMLVMHRQPLVRTDSGYHVPSNGEVIAGIKAFFDLAYLSGDASPSAVGGNSDSKRVRTEIIPMLQGISSGFTDDTDNMDFQCDLLHGIKFLLFVLGDLDTAETYMDPLGQGTPFTVPVGVPDALSKVSIADDIHFMLSRCMYSTKVRYYLMAWIDVHTVLEKTKAGPMCECPFVYFFVKYCLEHDLGVPKLALALYDRMNMQLSREFIRCANPACELNRLDKSTGQVKFKKCSRCQAVIYCSRECQVAHYPEHRRLCRDHSTG